MYVQNLQMLSRLQEHSRRHNSEIDWRRSRRNMGSAECRTSSNLHLLAILEDTGRSSITVLCGQSAKNLNQGELEQLIIFDILQRTMTAF